MEILLILLGSALTILGGFLANRQTFTLSQISEARRIKREKLDELARLVCDIDDWIETFEGDVFKNPPRHTINEPMERIYLIASIYFPDLWPEIHPACETSRNICQCIRGEAIRRLKDGTVNKSYFEQRSALTRPFLEAKSEAIEAIAKYATKIHS